MSQMVKDFDWRRPGTFLQVAMAASFKPRAFFSQMDNRGDLFTPLMFLLWVHLLHSVAALIAGLAPGAVAQALILRLLMDLIFIGLIYTIGHHIMRNPLNAGGFLRVVCYCLGIKLVAVLYPFLPEQKKRPDGPFVLILLYNFVFWPQGGGGLHLFAVRHLRAAVGGGYGALDELIERLYRGHAHPGPSRHRPTPRPRRPSSGAIRPDIKSIHSRPDASQGANLGQSQSGLNGR